MSDVQVHGKNRGQEDVSRFYDRLTYPSRVSDKRFSGLMPLKKGEIVGDFGCGQSLFYSRFRDHSPAPVFFDVAESCLRSIDYGFRVKGDIQELPFRSGSFDKIVSIGVIHHLPDPDAALEEVHRVLKDGGLFVMGVYHNKGVQPRLRALYERLGFAKPLGFWFGKAILKRFHSSKGRKMTDREIEARASDWLETPIVRYASPEHWKDLLENAGFEARESERISTMSILFGRKHGKA